MHMQAGELLDAVCGEVVDACVALVKQLKGITATYRMTSKGPPLRHSHYVTSAQTHHLYTHTHAHEQALAAHDSEFLVAFLSPECRVMYCTKNSSAGGEKHKVCLNKTMC